jgi:hypothetical protein
MISGQGTLHDDTVGPPQTARAGTAIRESIELCVVIPAGATATRAGASVAEGGRIFWILGFGF